MARIRDLFAQKDARLLAIPQTDSVLQAALLMNEERVGALIVCDQTHMVGILTERDLLRRVMAAQRDPAATSVASVMTRDVICGEMQDDLDDVREIMRERRIRHMPIVDEHGQPLGMISIGDLNAWQLDGQARTIHHLHEYIHGVA